MSVIRVNKTKDYTVMSNYHLRDKNLSLKAKGLLSQMLSLPEDWDYTVKGLCAINKENETAINSTLKELKEAGYLIVTKKMPDKTATGRIEYTYDIYESPKQKGKKQDLENLGVEFQGVENQGQLITDLPSTENKEKPTTEVVGEKTDIKNHIFPKAEAEKAIGLWNSIPSLPNVMKLSDKRKSALKNLLKEYDWGQFEQVIENIRTSSFLNGTSGRWQCSFDWILNRNNFLKVLEGQYKDRSQNEQKAVGKVAHGNEDYNEDFDMESYMERRRRQG